jgi:hypothetical protein
MDQDNYKMISLALGIIFIIVIGLYLSNPTGYAVLTCADSVKSYKVLEPYKTYDYNLTWGELYLQVLDKVNINIPSNRPAYISYNLCSPCKYNITFISDLPTNFFIFDNYSYVRYFNRMSAFPLVSNISSENTNFSFELATAGKYYFVFDRSAQGTNFNDPATGRLIIYELRGFNQSTQLTKYREVTKYRNVTRCE